MELYHGSSKKIEKIEQRQAGTTTEVPKDELLNAIYLTSDYSFAFASGVRPEGLTNISLTNKTIKFEHPELFEPEKEIYIYRINSESIPEGHLRKIDSYQFVVEGLKEINYEKVDIKEAGEIAKYYKLINPELSGLNREIRNEFDKEFKFK